MFKFVITVQEIFLGDDHMNCFMYCDQCKRDYKKKGSEMYVVLLKKHSFVEDGKVEENIEFRQLQICKECFNSNPIYKILIEQNRQY